MMKTIRCCRACGSDRLTQILDLGKVPLANALRKADELEIPEERFPLTLLFCPTCSLVQIRETVAPERLFSHYHYFSSFSDAMLEHARAAAAAHKERFGLGADSLVVEIASNDGYLLKNFVEWGVPVLGIDPAENIAAHAEASGVPTLCDFFGADLAARLAGEGRQADLILANNVVAHVADLRGVARGIATLLKPNGVAVLEFPYVGEMIDELEFDTIYHEHLCYFSLHAVRHLFADHGLTLFDVERLSIHGGSLRVFLRHEGEPSDAVRALLEDERERGLTDEAYYRSFADRVESLRVALAEELEERRRQGQQVAAYGASAKGSTLMNAFELGKEQIAYVVDRSTAKQGFFTPGNHLEILPAEALAERRPDAVLLLTWNFAEEIYRQQAAYLEAGGEFIVPVPEVRVVNKESLR